MLQYLRGLETCYKIVGVLETVPSLSEAGMELPRALLLDHLDHLTSQSSCSVPLAWS